MGKNLRICSDDLEHRNFGTLEHKLSFRTRLRKFRWTGRVYSSDGNGKAYDRRIPKWCWK